MTHPSSPLGDTAVADKTAATGAGKGSASGPGPAPKTSRSGALLSLFQRDLGVDRFSGLYVIVIMIVAFSLWEPSTFGTINNGKVILASEAITGIIALGAVIGLVAGVFDLSIAANMSLSISVVGKLQASAHINALLAVLI